MGIADKNTSDACFQESRAVRPFNYALRISVKKLDDMINALPSPFSEKNFEFTLESFILNIKCFQK